MKHSVKVIFAFTIFVYFGISLIMASRPGGISDTEKSSNPEVQGMLKTLDSQIKSSALELLAGSIGNDTNSDPVKKFKAANITESGYKTQVVAGTNYFVRALIGDYVFHVRIYQNLQNHATISKVIGPKEASDPIEYF